MTMYDKAWNELEQAAAVTQWAAQAQRDRDEAIRKAHVGGFTIRVIAAAIGLSPARVGQIVKEKP